MTNGKNTESPCKNTAIAENHDVETMSSETIDALSKLKNEMHGFLQLSPEDLAKVDHIEWKLDWKPVLTSRIYPKKD